MVNDEVQVHYGGMRNDGASLKDKEEDDTPIGPLETN